MWTGRSTRWRQSTRWGLKTDTRRNLDVFQRGRQSRNTPSASSGVGTRDTLADREGAPIREELLAFYREYYSANLMTLAVLGRESLDELQALVEQNVFTGAQSQRRESPTWTVPLYPPDSLPMQVNIQPVASERELQLSFPTARGFRPPLPAQVACIMWATWWDTKGEGSLLSLLKQEGWAEALAAGGGLSYRGGSAFYISITLTEAGMQQREQVLAKVFEYLRLLREEGAQEWLYREQARVAELQFRFAEKTPPDALCGRPGSTICRPSALAGQSCGATT